MSQNELVAQLVGWIDERFEKGTSSVFDEENASTSDYVFSPGGQLQRLRCIYDDKGIRDFQFSFDSLLEAPASTGKQMEFDFKPGERLASLAIYISFKSGKKESGVPEVASSVETPKKQPLLPPEGEEDTEHIPPESSAQQLPEFEESDRQDGLFTTESGIITGVGFVFLKEETTAAQKTGGGGWIADCLNKCVPCGIDCIEGVIEIAQDLPHFVPLFILAFISQLRSLLLHVILPLYDVVSDIIAGYYYYDQDVYLITGLILLFVLLPHIFLSVALIWEMVIDAGAFDEYPKALVRFYKSKPTIWNYLNNTIKFLTLPLFSLLNFFYFFTMLFGTALRLLGKLCCSLRSSFVERVGQRHPENIRKENVGHDAWSKITLMELFFETIPQLVTQVSALVALYNSGDHTNAFPVFSSIVVSILNLAYQSYSLVTFMRRTHLTLLNTIRYMMSSALDFFPIFNLYKNSIDRVLLQFYDNSVLLELWGPLQLVLKRNTSLKALTIYLEDTGDWIDMTLDLMDSLAENDRLEMDTLDLCVEAFTVEEATEAIKRIPEIKNRFYELLRKERVKTVYVLVHSMINIGIANVPAEQLNTLSISVDGFKWSWDWPSEQSNRIEYRIELEEGNQNDD